MDYPTIVLYNNLILVCLIVALAICLIIIPYFQRAIEFFAIIAGYIIGYFAYMFLKNYITISPILLFFILIASTCFAFYIIARALKSVFTIICTTLMGSFCVIKVLY